MAAIFLFFPVMLNPPRSWWNHSTLTSEVSVQLEAVNQWPVFTRTINLRPALLASCSLPFQQGSYFSARAFSPCPTVWVSSIDWRTWVFYFPYLFTVSCQRKWRFRCFYFLLHSFVAVGWNVWSKCQVFPFPRQTSHILILLCRAASQLGFDKPNNVPND